MNDNVELPQIDDYRSLFLNKTPLLDVRAPIEFIQGAFPFAVNAPLMNDQERAEIGLRYKKSGQDEAIKLGHQLIQGDIKNTRVKSWQDFFSDNPQGLLYCFRGGMRSKISQQWLYEKTGLIVPRVKGGYKALRRYLIDEFEKSLLCISPIILSGRTGAGKTLLLKKIQQQIDLEKIYHHRGSVFGKHVTQQPSQISIENTLSIEMLQCRERGYTKIILEDEGGNIGSRRLPENLIKKMQQSPLILLEISIDERIQITFQEYIIDSLMEYQSFFGKEKGYQNWSAQLQDAIDRIQRRLGGVRHKELKALLNSALQQQLLGDIELHKEWIKTLLTNYYDPMYDYQLSKKKERVIYKGSQEDVLHYLSVTQEIR